MNKYFFLILLWTLLFSGGFFILGITWMVVGLTDLGYIFLRGFAASIILFTLTLFFTVRNDGKK